MILEDAFDGFPYVAQGTIIDDGKGTGMALFFRTEMGWAVC